MDADEPMDECLPDSTTSNVESPKKTSNSLLRPGSMVLMTITLKDYEDEYWPKLRNAINQLLTMKPGEYLPISYEQMYSCVYKCVCKQFSERLYEDLIKHMKSHVLQLNEQLQNHINDGMAFVERVSFVMNQYLQALAGIVPIFNYMNRFYVETKLKTNLSVELTSLFREHVIDNYIHDILDFLESASNQPFTISPPTMAGLIKNLYSLSSDYARHKPELFSRHIPNILPPTNVMNLERYIEEARQMKTELQHLPDFKNHEERHKRLIDEDIQVK